MNYVNELQERMQASDGKNITDCETMTRIGGPDHMPEYMCTLVYGEEGVTEVAIGKKAARQAAAKAMLKILG